jgi:tetrahydromethanopterin S-methyltransferase subunit F
MPIASLVQDLRYTLRTLRRDAGFAMFAIGIAGLGIGASSTVFSVVNALLLRPLPFADPERLVWIANHDTSGLSGQTTQVGHMLDLRERPR